MALFTNQALLTYRNVVTSSNVATGEILDTIRITKTSLVDSYGPSDTLTYIISIFNSSTVPLFNLTVSDDLGVYPFADTSLVPLEYVDGSARYFVNGALVGSPTVSAGTNLVFSGIDLPAGGNGIIAYEVTTTQFAPLAIDSEITNIATVSGACIPPVEASETITVAESPIVNITKSISPVPVVACGEVVYTFVIENTGNTPLRVDDNAVITDIFNPELSALEVTFNGTPWAEGTNYTYENGVFTTIAGQVVVDAGQYTQNPQTGAWSVIPSTSILVVRGTLGQNT